MMYGICRVEKRGRQAVGGLQAEANREAEKQKNFAGSDIDWEKTKENVKGRHHSMNWMRDIDSTIKSHGIEKVRKDAIVMLDGVYTASPAFFSQMSEKEMKRYFNDCLRYHIREFCHGDDSLVINTVIHLDEKTPHLHVCSVPITEDHRLSAKRIMGGRKEYREHQDHFYDQVSKHWNLDRGQIQDHEHTRDHIDQVTHKLAKTQKELSENLSVLDQTSEWIKQAEELHQKTIQELDRAEKTKKKQLADVKKRIDRLDQEVKNRSEALSGLDLPKKVQEISDELEEDMTPKIEPLRETESKTSLLGKNSPATVTIKKDDFERLIEISGKVSLISRISEKVSDMLEEVKEWSDRAFLSKVDAEKISREAEADRRVQDIKKDLDESQYQWGIWEEDSRSKDEVIRKKDEDIQSLQKTIRSKDRDISALQSEISDKDRFYEKVKSSYPKWLRAVEKVIQYEKKFDGEGLYDEEYSKYRTLCEKSRLDPRDDIVEVFEREMDRGDDLERG